MQKLISMSCPNCGGRLQVDTDVQQFNCAHCGAEWRVALGEGIISLRPITKQLESIKEHTSGIKQSSDRIAAELAIPRLEREIPELENKRDGLQDEIDSLRSVVEQPLPEAPNPSGLKHARIWVIVFACIELLFLLLVLQSSGQQSAMMSGLLIFGALPLVFSILVLTRRSREPREYDALMAARQEQDEKINNKKAQLENQLTQVNDQLQRKREDLRTSRRLLGN